MITILVMILWACIVAEHAIVRQARDETMQLLRRQRSVPVRYEQKAPPARRPPSRAGATISLAG